MKRRPVAVALVHHPVLDRRGDVVTTAVTNLDLHDIARIGRTYGIDRYYVATPASEQQRLVEKIIGHWRQGFGAGSNPDRGEALSLIEVVPTLERAIAGWRERIGEEPLPLLTGASLADGISFAEGRRLVSSRPLLLVFGTGWGLSPALARNGWRNLAPIRGADGYNHLPVRAAAAIVLDRLLGEAGGST